MTKNKAKQNIKINNNKHKKAQKKQTKIKIRDLI